MSPLKLVEDEPTDVTEFRIPASDTKGHSARNWFRTIPAMARQVDQIVQSKAFPYRTKADLIRHALHRHMKWLASKKPLPSVSGQVDAIIEVMRDEEMNKDFSLVFAKLEERIANYLEGEDRREAVRLVMVIKSHVEEMPSGFWKRKYVKKLEDKFGKLMKEAPRLKLTNID